MVSRRVAVFGVVVVWCISQALALPTTTYARRSIRVALEPSIAGDVEATTLQALTQSLHTQLRSHRGVQLVSRERADFVLWGSVTRLSNRVHGDKREIDCNVSVIVTEARGGSIRFTLAGHAVARGDLHAAALTEDVMTAAVRGALSPLERGLRAVQVR